MCSNQKTFAFIFIFSLALIFLFLNESTLTAQWQFNQDFKVSDNFVGIGKSMVPEIAMCNSGNSVIVWVENYYELYYQLMDENNNHIGISVSIATSAIPDGYALDVGMNGVGDFSVVWADQQTSDVYLKRFGNDGTHLGSEVKANEDDIYNSSYFPISFTMNGNGNSVVVWENNKDSYKNIY